MENYLKENNNNTTEGSYNPQNQGTFEAFNKTI